VLTTALSISSDLAAMQSTVLLQNSLKQSDVLPGWAPRFGISCAHRWRFGSAEPC